MNEEGETVQSGQKPFYLSDFFRKLDINIDNVNPDNIQEQLSDFINSPSMQHNEFLYNLDGDGNGLFNVIKVGNTYAKNPNGSLKINPVIAFLHEHIHALLTSIGQLEVTYSNKEQIKSLIKNNNALLDRIINEFSKDFESSIKNENYLKQLRSIYNISDNVTGLNSIIDNIRNFIKAIQKDILDSNSALDNDYISDGMAQEFYSYLTDPYYMSVLSITTPSDIKYDRKSKPNFIDKLINMLVELYNKLAKYLSSEYGFKINDENYTKILKDVLADFYSDLINPPSSIEVVTEVKEDITDETKQEDEDFDFDVELPNREIKDFSNLQDSKNILIFTQSKQHLDDNLLPIC